jgi:tRNA(Ile)-lysidine synthase
MQQRLVLEALAQWLPTAPRSAAAARDIADLISAEVGRHVNFGAGTVWRTREGLAFRPGTANPPRTLPTKLHPGTSVDLPQGTVSLDLLDTFPEDVSNGSANVAYLDADRLAYPLTVRPWRSGDRLQPLGMTGSKKVSDLLTDARIPPYDRPGVLVVVSDDTIVWVVGIRLDERFKVHPSTRHVARLGIVPSSSAS